MDLRLKVTSLCSKQRIKCVSPYHLIRMNELLILININTYAYNEYVVHIYFAFLNFPETLNLDKKTREDTNIVQSKSKAQLHIAHSANRKSENSSNRILCRRQIYNKVISKINAISIVKMHCKIFTSQS